MRRIVCALSLPFLLESQAHGSEVFGRFSAGVFTSTETFTSNADGVSENDAQNFTGRAYLRVADIGTDHTEFVGDLRDNYDLFGALNATQSQLAPSNGFQSRQLYVGNFPSKSKFNYEVGRFGLSETGGTYTDGVALQRRQSDSTRVGVFGGLNPFSYKDQLIEYQPNATDWGAYYAYAPNDSLQGRNYFINAAFVEQQYNQDIDRQYFYENFYYQWGPKSRLMLLSYLDFAPTVKVQTASMNWDQQTSLKQVGHLHLLAVDTVTYLRLASIRSTLPSSAYEQAQVYWDFSQGRGSLLQPMLTYGHRELDQLSKTEGQLRYVMNDFADIRFDANFYGGLRNNFVSNDIFVGGGAGFYSSKWEYSADLQYAQEAYATQTLHPITVTANATFVQNRELFYTASVEVAQDENVTIFASFLKLTYRFGSKELAPLRDGAPPRGSL